MPYIPLYQSANAFLIKKEIEEAERNDLREGEVIYAKFGKKHANDDTGHHLKPAMPEHLKHWHDSAFHHNDGASVTAIEAYEHHCEWAEKHGYQPHKWQEFSHHLAQSGLVRQKIAGRMRYIGVGLNNHPHFEESVETSVEEGVIGALGKLAVGTVKAGVGGIKLAHRAYQQHQINKTKTFHTVLYSPDNGDTWHYHSHHESEGGADKAHENLNNFNISDDHIARLHLNKSEIKQAKAGGNDFIRNYHAKLLAGGKTPTEDHLKKADKLSEPQKTAPTQTAGKKSFDQWHTSITDSPRKFENLRTAAHPLAHFNDYKVYAAKYNHKPLSKTEFDKHFQKSKLGQAAIKPIKSKPAEQIKPKDTV